MAKVETSLAVLLQTLNSSLSSANSAFPAEHDTLFPPSDPVGISLLDSKYELLLSYLQNLVFLIILKLRNDPDNADIDAEAKKRLHEQRVYLEKGVRPLESRLKYQIDKVLRAADDAERALTTRQALTRKTANGIFLNGDTDSDALDSDSGSNASVSDAEGQAISNLTHRANPEMHKMDHRTSKSADSNSNGPYKPPRITPTSMPSTTRSEPRARNRKSHLIDEYIANDLSSAPQAQPSIGSNNTILDRGRGGLSVRERETEKERTRYEESNLTRLPTMTKAEKRKARGTDQRDVFGGEDWTGLGGLGDHVSRSVGAKRKGGILERREKRKRDTGDSIRGNGHNLGIGESFEKRRKVLQGRMTKRKR